jgi:hypothetical protein
MENRKSSIHELIRHAGRRPEDDPSNAQQGIRSLRIIVTPRSAISR